MAGPGPWVLYDQFKLALGKKLLDLNADLGEAAGFDAALIGTPWDYWDHREAFLAKLEAIAAGVDLTGPFAFGKANAQLALEQTGETLGSTTLFSLT
mgnify:CR=1 FL=1